MKSYLFVAIMLLTNSVYSQTQDQYFRKLYYSDFEKILRSDMGYDTIISRYGDPNTTTGSGLIILIYKLADSTTVSIGCHNKGIVYAKYCDKNGIIRDLIPRPSPDLSPTKRKLKRPKHKNKLCFSGVYKLDYLY